MIRPIIEMATKTSYRIRAASRKDIPAITRIRYHAFGTNNLHAALWPEHLRLLPNKGSDQQAWLTARTEKHFDEDISTMHYIVAVQDLTSGKEAIVGCGEWISPGPEESETATETEQSVSEREAQLPAAMDKAVLRERTVGTRKLEEAAESVLGKENMKNMWCKIAPLLPTLDDVPGCRRYTKLVTVPNSIAVDPDYLAKVLDRCWRCGAWNRQRGRDGTYIFLLQPQVHCCIRSWELERSIAGTLWARDSLLW